SVATGDDPDPTPPQGIAALEAYALDHSTRLGPAVDDAVPFLGNGISGYIREYQNAIVLTNSTTRTYAVMPGPIRDEWGQRLGARGSLGWPTGEQENVAGGVRQKFQGGTLSVINGVASVSGDPLFDSQGAIESYRAANASRLGAPIGPPIPWKANNV